MIRDAVREADCTFINAKCHSVNAKQGLHSKRVAVGQMSPLKRTTDQTLLPREEKKD